MHEAFPSMYEEDGFACCNCHAEEALWWEGDLLHILEVGEPKLVPQWKLERWSQFVEYYSAWSTAPELRQALRLLECYNAPVSSGQRR